VAVGGDEAVGVVRQAGDPRAAETRERDGALDRDRLGPGDPEAVGTEAQRDGVGEQPDAALGQQLADAHGDAHAEDVQRVALRRDDHEPCVGHACGADVLGRHKGKLVERQRPGDARRDREGHGAHTASDEIVEQLAHGADVAGARESDRAGHGHVGARAHGDEQRVVADLIALHGTHAPGRRIDGGEPVAA
jgi:hypothetical protein